MKPKYQQRGFALIEAMVALIVVSIGGFGLLKLNTEILRGSGAAKTRVVALQLTQSISEKIRNYDLTQGCPTDDADLNDLGAISSGLSTSNASYRYESERIATESGDNRISYRVCVAWDSSNTAACDVTDNNYVIKIKTIAACNHLGTSGNSTIMENQAQLGNTMKTPTGRGIVGGGSYTPGSVPGTVNTFDGIGTADGTKSYLRDDGVRELIDSATGKVLLTVAKSGTNGCESEAPDFSTITGKAFIEAKNGEPIVTSENLFVLSSDASYCTKLPFQNDWVLPAGATGNSIKYFYTYYQCYIGAEWWGNIGLVRIDNANANNRVCVGSPVSSNTGTLFSKHSQLNTNRAYRGYRIISNNPLKYETKGIGESDTINNSCTTNTRTVYNYTPNHLKNHHFVHTVITGQASDAACNTVQTTLNGYAPTGSLGSSAGNPTVTIPNDNSSITVSTINNPGKFYCLSSTDGIDCPNVTTSSATPSTLVHGTITNHTGSASALTGIDLNGSSCNTEALTTNGTVSYIYSCQINWGGFIGSSWTGAINFSASGGATLCPGNTAPTIVPTGSNVAYSINAANASDAPNSINFTDIPMAVTDITLDFDVKNSSCGSLGQPNLSAWTFSGSGTNSASASLTWASISGATAGYRIRTCSVNGQNTSCSPSSNTPTLITATNYTTTAGSMCIQVTAFDGTTEGPASTKCVKYTSSTKTYSNF